MEHTSGEARPSHLNLQQLLRRAWALWSAQPATHTAAILAVILGTLVSLGVAGPALFVGYLRLVAKQIRGERIVFGDLLAGMRSFTPALGLALLMTLGIAAASVLIVIPGVVLAVAWSYAFWFLASKSSRPLAALRASWQLAREQIGSVLLVLLLVAVLSILGVFLVLGWLVTVPLGIIVMSIAFEELDDPERGLTA